MVKHLKIETVAIETVKPNPNNPRTITPENKALLVKSIKDFPQMLELRPLVVDKKGVILGGNMRYDAAIGAGLKKIPIIRAESLTPAQAKEFIIKDNVGFGEWDWDALANGWDTDQLQDWGMDLPGDFGIDASGGLTAPDEVPDVPANPLTVLGDVWIMGKHRIVCGDSTNADTVAKCLNGVKPHLMVTDPPYGVEYDADWRNSAKRPDGSTYGGFAVGKVENDDNADWSEAWSLFPGDVAYVWHAGNMAHTVADSLVANGLNIRAQIIWNKSNMVISRGDYHPKHEPCWYAVR